MRSRILLAFVAVTILMCTGWFFIRSYTLEHQIREREAADLQRQVNVLGTIVDGAQRDGRPVSEQMLRPWAGPEMAVRFDPRAGGGTPVVVRGDSFDGSTEPGQLGDDLRAVALASNGAVTLIENSNFYARAVYRQWWSIGTLAAFIVVLTLGVGLGAGHLLSRPFRQLAKAATALGRGRFQLDLPDTRIPEARAIATALEVSAAEIEARLVREREFAAQASHALRTPLTGLRLELDEVLATGEMSDDVRHSLERSLSRLDQLDAVTGELVALARQSSLPRRAEVSMRDLAAQTARRWSDELAAHGRGLTATTAGELDLTFSPGPVEQILELLLTDVTYRTRGHVRMLHEVGDDGVLRLTVAADQRWSGRPEPAGAPVARARAVAMALGGRLEGDWAEGGYALWIPRR